MKAHLHYLRYVLRHKRHVFFACLRYGLIWAGFIHDLSKFHPAEWGPYVDYFYGGPHDSAAKQRVQARFDAAWNHHQKVNPHHWQFWVLLRDDGSTECLPMPDRYRKEMVADWRGASLAIRGSDQTPFWYARNKDRMQLHPDTRTWVERELGFGGN